MKVFATVNTGVRPQPVTNPGQHQQLLLGRPPLSKVRVGPLKDPNRAISNKTSLNSLRMSKQVICLPDSQHPEISQHKEVLLEGNLYDGLFQANFRI
jgi:hypothetical protein